VKVLLEKSEVLFKKFRQRKEDRHRAQKFPPGMGIIHRTVGHTEYKQKCPALEVFQGGTIIFY
jgi:hypothetical protein